MRILCRPRNLFELSALLTEAGRVLPLAGGTDLMVAGRGLPEDCAIADMAAIPDLRGIGYSPAEVRIGAATTVAEIETDAVLATHFPALVQAAAECGAVQIRNRATIGGNIANAAPAADLVPPLLLFDARLALVRPGWIFDEVRLADFRPADRAIITHVHVPIGRPQQVSAFAKLGLRRTLTVARLNLAIAAIADGMRLRDVRIVAGALGPKPIRFDRAASMLEMREMAEDPCPFLEALSAEVLAAIPGRASAAWKQRAIRGLGLDLIARLSRGTPGATLFDQRQRWAK